MSKLTLSNELKNLKVKKRMHLNVREIGLKDVDLIANYWLDSDASYMESLGVDLRKLPKRAAFKAMLKNQINCPNDEKRSYALIWELDGKQIGHSNVNPLIFGKEAFLHLHIWNSENRKKGIGSKLLKKSLPFYFENLELDCLYSEPYSQNKAPNKTLEKLGFKFIKKYLTTPGSLNFEQEVNQWKLSKTAYQKGLDEML